MRKQELLDHVQEAIRREESATTVYMKHLSAMVLRSNLSKTQLTTVRQIIETLTTDNKKHKQLLESLYEKISGEDIHDF